MRECKVAPTEVTKVISKNLLLTNNPRAIYLGALSGLDNRASSQVAYSASKFGLRGAVQSLRIALKRNQIGFTVISPGNVATEEVILNIEEGHTLNQDLVPIYDIIPAIEFVLSASSCVEVGGIYLIQENG